MRSKNFPLIDNNNSSITELIPYFERLLNAQVYKSDVVSATESFKTNFFSLFRYSGNTINLNAHNITDSFFLNSYWKKKNI